ncbi:MAG: hypothetical protein WCI43_06440, partial [Candidatus Firestonebacteria bacterium]
MKEILKSRLNGLRESISAFSGKLERVGLDAGGNNAAVRSVIKCGGHLPGKNLFVGDEMISGNHQQVGLGIDSGKKNIGLDQGGSRIARGRFADKVCNRKSGQTLSNIFQIFAIGNDKGIFYIDEFLQPHVSLRKQRL